MSTRCHLVVKGKGFEKAYIYHHCDGYPDGVGAEIVEEMKKYNNLEWRVNEVVNKILSIDDEYELDTDIHGDEDYIYLIDCNSKKISCYNADYYDDEGDSGGDEIVIPGNIDFSTLKNTEEDRYPQNYLNTFTKIVCAMIIHPNPNHNNYTDLVNAAKSVTDKMFETIRL